MIKNYLLVALRTLWKHRVYSLINIAGLAAGMACCLVIFLYVRDEMSFDRFHERAERIYRITMQSTLSGEVHSFARTPFPMGPLLTEEIPGVEAAVRVYGRSAGVQALQNGSPLEKARFQEPRFWFADSTFFRIFSFPLLKGNAAAALARPHSVVLTEETARKYFAAADPIGQTILVEGRYPFTVTGICRSLPSNSHIQFDFLASIDDILAMESNAAQNFLRSDWLFGPVQTYVLLRPGVTKKQVHSFFPAFIARHANHPMAASATYDLQRLADIHLYSEFTDEEQQASAITYVYIVSAIALLTLLIACINFINLSTARSLGRTKEVGIRKALGAQRTQIVRQFLGESLLITFVAEILLPLVNSITEKTLSTTVLTEPDVLLGFVVLFIFTGLLAGSYPALFISRVRIVMAMKGTPVVSTAGSGRLRKALVIAQFVISIVLISGAIIIARQMQFLHDKSLGFRKDHMITIPLFSENLLSVLGTKLDGSLRTTMNTFEDALLSNPKIEAVTLSSGLPGRGTVITLVIPEGHTGNDNLFIPWLSVDYDFAETYGLQQIAGRGFSRQAGSDHLTSFILNESAVRRFGWTPQQAVGKTIARGDATGGKKGTVIGVVRDFHMSPLHEPLKPLIIDVSPLIFGYFSVRIRAEDMPQTIGFIGDTWKKFFPDRMFEYEFLDRQLDTMYRSEERLGRLIRYFAGLAMFISCLGLLGLASFATAQRTKEIGVRKVMGASVWSILLLLVRECTLLVATAFVLAVPLAWWSANLWLQEFAYRIQPGISVFALAGMFTLIIAWLTVGYLSVRAARMNPVLSLRCE
jgi:putative ABC transport system permease protein